MSRATPRKSVLSKYRAEHGERGSSVSQISVCWEGYENDPEVKFEVTVLRDLASYQAEQVAQILNQAFNAGREFAKQR
jgi:hypothetical protein